MKLLITAVITFALLCAQSCINEPSKKGNDDTAADDEFVVLTLNIYLSNVEVDEIVVGLLNDGTSFESTSEVIAEGSEAAKLTFTVPMGEAITINYTCFYKNDLVARNSKTVTLQSDSIIESIPDVKALIFFTGNDTTIFINEQYTVDVLWEDDSDSYELRYQFGGEQSFVSTSQYRFDELGSYLVVTQALDGVNELFDTVSVTVIDYSDALPNESSNDGIELSTDSESSTDMLSSSVVESSTVSSSLSSDERSSSSHVSSSSGISSSSQISSSMIGISSLTIDFSSSSIIHHSIIIATEDSDKLSVDISEYSVPHGELTMVPVTVTGVNGGTLDEWSVEGDCEVSGGTSLEVTCTGAGTVTALYTRKLVSSITISGSDEISIFTIGTEYQLSHAVIPFDADDGSVVWKTANSAVATVTQSGLLTTTGVGSVNITVEAQDKSGVSETVTVHVLQNTVIHKSEGALKHKITALSGGGFVIANEQYTNAGSSNYWAEFSIYSPEGNVVATPIEFRDKDIVDFTITDLGNDRFVVISNEYYTPEGETRTIYKAYFSIYTTQGVAIVNKREIIAEASDVGIQEMRVLPLTSGEYLLLYRGGIGLPYDTAYLGMLRFDSDGNTIGSETVMSPYYGYNDYDVAVLTNGNILIMFAHSHSASNPRQQDAYFVVVSPDGSVVVPETLIHEAVYRGAVAALSNGTFVLSYIDKTQGEKGYLNFYTNDGGSVESGVEFNRSSDGTSYHDLVDLGDGYCMVAYSTGYNNSDGGYKGSFTKFAYDGSIRSFGKYGTWVSYTDLKSYDNSIIVLSSGVVVISYGRDGGLFFSINNIEHYAD
ncbi:MAG: Ig-like domain-containing protein [Fibrobacterales bacterium]